MKDFLRSGSPAALNLGDITPVRLPYYLSSLRWHGDSRPASAVIAVHDILSTGKSWTPFVRSLSQLPVRNVEGTTQVYTATNPLDVYALDLRMHGKAFELSATKESSYLLQCAADVAAFREAYIASGTKLHLVGIGVGAQVCALASLAMPTHVSSLTMLTSSGDSALVSTSCSVESVKESLQMLSDAIFASSSWTELQEMLKKRIPNEWERMLLLQHVSTNSSGDKQTFQIQSRVKELVDGSFDLSWPTSRVTASPEPSSSASASPVFSGKATILHHGLSQSLGDNTKLLFPAIEAVSMPSFGFLSNGISDVDLAVRIGEAMSVVATTDATTVSSTPQEQ